MTAQPGTQPAFAFPFSLGDALSPLLSQLPDGGVDVMDGLQERDTIVEDAFTFCLFGLAANPSFTAVSGGATITFPRGFLHVPVVLICEGDVAGTAPVTYRQVLASTTTSSFKVKVYSGATEQTTGTFRVAYIAVGT